MADEIDVSGLTAKRDELLAENKRLKARLAELEGERDAERARAEKAEGEFRRVTVDEPVEAMLADLFVVPLRHVMGEVREHFSFIRDEAGALQIRAKDGQPVTLEDGTEVAFEPEPIRKALLEVGTLGEVVRGTLATGGGAPGGSAGQPAGTAKLRRPELVAPRFGLR